jgi:pyruvate dehydrogenase E1 component alpha subunit
MYDSDRYRDKAEIEEWKSRDPIPSLVERLTASGALADGDLERLEAEVDAEVDDAVAFAEAGTDEAVADLERFVTSEPVQRLASP